MTFTLNATPTSCERCGYNAQFNWEGVNVCGMGCYEILMIQRANLGPEWTKISIQKLLGDSVQGVQDTLDNAIKEGESIKLPAVTYSRYYPKSDSWVIELNRYHRDNLIWLFNAIGYPHGNGVEPFTMANSGDWVGEIPNMLSKPGKDCVLEEGDRPNRTIEELRTSVGFWLKYKDDK